MRSILIGASLVLGYSFAAPPPVAGASHSVDPCTLLTAAEVSAALGIASRPGRPFLGSSVVCYFAADTGFNGTSPSVTLMVMTSEAYENGAHLGGSLTAHPVTGLGDEAYRVGSGGYVKLAVRKGSSAFSVTVVPGEKSKKTPDEVEQIEEALAKKVAARL